MKKLKNFNVFLMTLLFALWSDALCAREEIPMDLYEEDFWPPVENNVQDNNGLPGENNGDDDFGAFLLDKQLLLDNPNDDAGEEIDENNDDY